MGGQKRWLLTFSLHCLCSSTSHLFISRLRLVYRSTLKIANILPSFASYYALLCIYYCFSHLFGLFSVTWLFLLFKFTRCFIYFLFLSDEGPIRSKRKIFISVSAVHQLFYQFRLVFLYIYIDIYTVPAQYTTFIFQYKG